MNICRESAAPLISGVDAAGLGIELRFGFYVVDAGKHKEVYSAIAAGAADVSGADITDIDSAEIFLAIP